MEYNVANNKMKKYLKLFCFVLLIFFVNNVVAQQNNPSYNNSKEEKLCPNPKCHAGKIYCEDCDYTGTIIQKCSACNGSGKIVKYKSNGQKYTVDCDACSGKGNVEVQCPRCGGNGYYTCPNCKGTGKVSENHSSHCHESHVVSH